MNIAVVHWILNDVGGINSWTENFILGLRRRGHNVQLFYGSHQRKLNCDPDTKVNRGRYHLLPAKLLSYHTREVAQSVRTLGGYDVVVFAHPSPHPTKGNMEVESPRGWQVFYTDVKKPKLSIFHDRHWDRSNPWIEEVREHVNYAHAAQHHFINPVKKFAGSSMPHGWSVFPLLIPSTEPIGAHRNRRFILATQWLSIKNHRHLIPYLGTLQYSLHSYGGGQMFHKLLPVMETVYREIHHNGSITSYDEERLHVHYGHVEYRSLLNSMRRAWFSVDLSTQGMTNMTHWEPMTVGAISIMEERVKHDEFCVIPDDCCLTFKLDNVVENLNAIAETSVGQLQKIQRKAWTFVQCCECSAVSADILRQAGIKEK